MPDKIHPHRTEIVQARRKRQAERAMQMLGDHIQISLRERLGEFGVWNRSGAMHCKTSTAPDSQAGGI